MFLHVSGDHGWDRRTAIKIQLVSSPYQSKSGRLRFHFNASLPLLLVAFGFNDTICILNAKQFPAFSFPPARTRVAGCALAIRGVRSIPVPL